MDKCDFCAQAAPMWWYPAKDFDMPALAGMQAVVSLKDWAACAQCYALIEANDYQALVDRTLTSYKWRWQQHFQGEHELVLRAVLWDLFTRFKENRTGPPRLIAN